MKCAQNTFMPGHRNCSVLAVATVGQGLKSGWTISAQFMSAVKKEAFVTVFLLFRCFHFQLIYKVVKEDNSGSNWSTEKIKRAKTGNLRVCRKHFPDGRPTSQNLNPTINLGYKTISSTKVPRKQPSVREGKHPVARRNICLKSSNSEFFQAHSTKSIGSSTSSKGGEQCSKHWSA